jgi:hypothetical protein
MIFLLSVLVLPLEDQKIILQFYLSIDQVDKVNELDPSFIQKVAESNPSTPGLLFEKAVVEKDYRTITELGNQVVLNHRRYKIMVEAYIKRGNLTNAERVAIESQDSRLIKLVKDAKQKQRVSKQLQKTEKEVAEWIKSGQKEVEDFSVLCGLLLRLFLCHLIEINLFYLQ